MYPILYEEVTVGVVPAHNGLGVLSDCISCEVEAVANDLYELVIDYPLTGIHAEDIFVGRYIKAKPNPTDDPQLFEIDRVGKVMNGKFSIYAKHISYKLSGFDITSGTAESAVAACSLLQSACQGFTITTDKTVSATFKIDTPASVRSYFAGREGSFLDVFGKSEIKYDNFSVRFLLNAGQDRGETIRYGKNLLELSQEIDGSNLYTHVRCFYKDTNGNVTVGDKVATGLILPINKTLVVDSSSDFETTPTVAQLTARATKYKNDNNLTTPNNNITLDFAQSEGLTGRVDLFDTVTIYYEALGIERAKCKCIRTKYDCIRERYIETEFGDVKADLSDTLANASKTLANTPTTSFMESSVKRATELITGNLGGNVVIHKNAEGRPFEILIMDTDDIETATKLWRWGLGGFGYSSTGYDGSYGTAITMNGEIVADFITAGTLNANLIKAGTISDVNGNSSIDMTSGVATLKNMKAKQSLELIDANGVKRGFFQYIESAGEPHLGIVDANNRALAEMWGNTIGGNIRLSNISGKRFLDIYGTSYGGAIAVKDSSENINTNIFTGSSGQGEVYIGVGGSVNVYLHGGSGNITCVSLTQTSSRKVKENIKPIEDSDKILGLQAVSFDYKSKAQGTDKRGFVAEDVAKVLPNLVSEGDVPSLDYIGMIPYLQDVVKKQNKRITELENRIARLEEMLQSSKGE